MISHHLILSALGGLAVVAFCLFVVIPAFARFIVHVSLRRPKLGELLLEVYSGKSREECREFIQQNQPAKPYPHIVVPHCDNCGALHRLPRNDECFMVNQLGAKSIRNVSKLN